MSKFFLFSAFIMIALSCKTNVDIKLNEKIDVLIVDGQNNHGIWPKTSIMMKDYLEETGLFQVDVKRTKYLWQGPHYNEVAEAPEISMLLDIYPIESDQEFIPLEKTRMDSLYHPDFDKYDVIISNFGWQTAPWPDQTKKQLEQYVKDGGGLVVIHAADNAWPEWKAYNEMIALGGWGGRNEKDGPYVYYNDDEIIVRDTTSGNAGGHGPQHEYLIKTRKSDHPIMKGLPEEWLHAKDELYDRLRGPAQNMTILATAYSDKEKFNGSGRHEPVLMSIEYGNGRAFHSIMGHMDYSMECVGFITTFIRGVEWAATGKVTMNDVPNDFPTASSTSIRKYKKKN
jgi:type 1 glutamine amidotransferase